MCGIIGLHLRDPELHPQLGKLMAEMVQGIIVRGPDSAGVALYGDKSRVPENHSAMSLLHAPEDLGELVSKELNNDDVNVEVVGETTVITASEDVEKLAEAVKKVAPDALSIGLGEDMVVYKSVGHPTKLTKTFRLEGADGWQGVAHTRLATESAIDAEGCHPYSVGTGLSLAHNGSFSNHGSIRRQMQGEGVEFDSLNDTEVAARYVAQRLKDGDDLDTALHKLGETFDGFYTLLVTTDDGFAVVRDTIACKPAIVAEHPRWVAMASEFQALAGLPGIEEANVFEPKPGKVYTWNR